MSTLILTGNVGVQRSPNHAENDDDGVHGQVRLLHDRDDGLRSGHAEDVRPDGVEVEFGVPRRRFDRLP